MWRYLRCLGSSERLPNVAQRSPERRPNATGVSSKRRLTNGAKSGEKLCSVFVFARQVSEKSIALSRTARCPIHELKTDMLGDSEIRRLACALAEELEVLRVPRFVSTAKAAQIACVTQKTIRSWVKRGELRDYYAGRDLRIRLDDLLTYLSRGRPDDVLDIETRVEEIMGAPG